MSKSKPETAQDVYEIICGLSAVEREELMAMLELDQNDGWASPEIKQAWIDESLRRIKSLDSGEVEAIPANEVLQRARQRLANQRK